MKTEGSERLMNRSYQEHQPSLWHLGVTVTMRTVSTGPRPQLLPQQQQLRVHQD